MRSPGPSVLRRQPSPPPPRNRRSLVAANNDDETEVVSANIRTRPYYSRRCKKTLTNIESLPHELLIEIFLRLPAQDIFDSRFVCRKWYRRICTNDFIYAHLQHAAYGLLFFSATHDSLFMTMQQGRVEISKLIGFECPSIRSSCNGLVLDYEESDPFDLNVVNPVTKQYFVLPPYAIPYFTCEIGIAYASASMAYKVVATCAPSRNPMFQPCAILTIGVDKSWRIVCTEHLPFTTKTIIASRPLITEGFMIWSNDGGDRVLTLDVETEVITETPPPVPQVDGHVRNYFSTGRYLSLFIRRGEYLWDVWEMKPKSGEWRKLPDITLAAQKCKLVASFGLKSHECLVPYGWLKYPEVLLFQVAMQKRTFIILYNLVTEEIDSIKLPIAAQFWRPVIHKNSLVRLTGC